MTTNKFNVKNLCVSGVFTAVICILSLISIPIQPIPFTLGLLAVFLTGAFLPPKEAFFSVLAYVMLGIAGIPVFAGFRGGADVIVGMTGGYIASYPIMALIVSLSVKYFKNHSVFALIGGMLTALALCYLLGTIWFCRVADVSFTAGLISCVYPFIPFDLLKIALSAGFALSAKKILIKSNLLPR